MDPFQSQPPKKLVRAAKTVQVVKPGTTTDSAPNPASINAVALAFIKEYKRTRASS